MVTTVGDAPVGDVTAGERRLAQWMLDVGTPPARVFEVLAEAAGIAHGARVSRGLDFAPGLPATEPRVRGLVRLAS
jgi:hypothetical protein